MIAGGGLSTHANDFSDIGQPVVEVLDQTRTIPNLIGAKYLPTCFDN